ncbi:MAG: hypothetical protein AB7I04_05860 [Pseudomonadales bacterium]
MRTRGRTLLLSLLAATVSVPALADHNSKWGEGWANMPNDIHNTRIDTRGDNDAFRDFVRYGNGADSVNRFETGDARGKARSVDRGQRPSSSTRQGQGGGRGR